MRKILVVCCFALVAVALAGCGLEGFGLADEGTGSDVLVADEGMDTTVPEEDVVVGTDEGQDLSEPDEGTDTMVPEVCVPDCAGKACGDDGCGGECGACPVIPCTTETCDAGRCLYKVVYCDDSNPCTTEYCNAELAQCIYTGVSCDDGNPCTVDTCNSDVGGCVHETIACSDSNSCTTDSCDPATGECVFDAVICDDGKDYTVDSCNPETGGCEFAKIEGACLKDSDCADGNSCTEDVCDSITHQCKLVEIICDFGNPCVVEKCIPSVVEVIGYICVPEAYIDCDDGNTCTTDSCDPDTGACIHEDVPECCVTDAQCSGNEYCNDGWCEDLDCDSAPQCWTMEVVDHECVYNPATEGIPCAGGYCDGLGVCQPPITDCDDGDKYTTDSEDPVTGECLHTELIFTASCTVPTSLIADGRYCEVWIGFGEGDFGVFLLKENEQKVSARSICGSSWTPSNSELTVRISGPGMEPKPWVGGAYAHLTDPDGNAVTLAEVDHSWSKPNNWATPETGIPWCQK